MNKTWDELKQQGSDHYKTGGIEPIDLYRKSGTFHDWAISNIQKYAFRNRKELVGNNINPKDMKKIIHLAELLMACYETDNLIIHNNVICDLQYAKTEESKT